MEQVKFILLEVGTMEELREYASLEEIFKDLSFKAPESFWVGIIDNKQAYAIAYTIPQFLDKYRNEYEEFKKNF